MARVSRSEVFTPKEIAIVHLMNRVVRRCFLMGDDPLTGMNYDHRKVWIEDQFQLLAKYFGIDLLCYSVMSNHFHLILRSRPDIVETWSNEEVAWRWLMLCPKRKRKDGSPCEPKENEINAIVNNAKLLAQLRLRLSDISWWMRLVCQRIAQRCNKEDKVKGKFWESRFHAVRLLDEQAVLSCAVYVDLNPIKAQLAEDLEHNDHTSIQLRLRDFLIQRQSTSTGRSISEEERAMASRMQKLRAGNFLAPLEIDELNDPLGPHPSRTGYRLSDKGFLHMRLIDYIALLEWTTRYILSQKRGEPFDERLSILERLNIKLDIWLALVTDFDKMFSQVAGSPSKVDAQRGQVRGQRFYMPRATRELMSA